MPIFVITTPAQPALPSSYTLAGSPPSCSTPKNHLCYIISADNGNSQPILYRDLVKQMVTALQTNTDSTLVKLKA